jgi:hypothetical protein
MRCIATDWSEVPADGEDIEPQEEDTGTSDQQEKDPLSRHAVTHVSCHVWDALRNL